MEINEFYYRIIIDETPYSISVDSNNDRIKIVLNQKILFDEVCASWMSPRTDIMYFPFSFKNKKIVIEIDDRELRHKYNIYVDNLSPIDGKYLYDELDEAKKVISKGFVNYLKANWMNYLFREIIWGATWYSAITFIEYNVVNPELWLKYRIFMIVFAILFSPVVIIGDWVSKKYFIKRFYKRFKNKNTIIKT